MVKVHLIGSLGILTFFRLIDTILWTTRSYFDMRYAKVFVASNLFSLIRWYNRLALSAFIYSGFLF